jgi:hypothetical protein
MYIIGRYKCTTYKFTSRQLCSHPRHQVHNTPSRKPIVAHLLIHSNYLNTTSGTGSCTLPVIFYQLVNPIRLQKHSFWRQPFAFASAYKIFVTAILTIMRTRGLKGHFLGSCQTARTTARPGEKMLRG